MKFVDFFISKEELEKSPRPTRARTLVISSIAFALFGDIIFWFRIDPQSYDPLNLSIFLFFLILFHATPLILRWAGYISLLSWILPIAGPVMTVMMVTQNGGINGPLIVAAPVYCFACVLLVGPRAGFFCSLVEAGILVTIGTLQITDPTILPTPLLSPERMLVSRTAATGVILILMGFIAAFYEQHRRTAETQLSSSEARYQYALQSAHEGVFDWNLDTQFTHFSPLFKTLLHYEPNAALLGEPFPDTCVHPHDLQGLRLSISRACDPPHTPVNIECRLITTSQTTRWFHIQAELRTGKERHLIGSIRDITERKHSEYVQEEFISTIGHELRTPLTSIIGSLKILNSPLLDKTPERRQEITALAERNAHRLLSMVNDFLDWQTISQQTFSLQPKRIALNALIQEVVDLNCGLEERYSTKLITKLPKRSVHAVIDSLRITQVLTNLISNAAKFSPDDSPVTISLKTDASRATISVQDHGSGIPKELQATVFERFKQGEQRTSNPDMKGTGLGLAICKSIIDLHEGELWFETGPKGTTFFFAINLPTQTTHHGFS